MIKKTMFALLATCAALFASPKAIVFDFGRVLTNAPNQQVVAQFIRGSFSLSADEFERANQQWKRALQMGKTDEEFWYNFARRKRVILPRNWIQELKKVMVKEINVNEGMYSFVNRLKQEGIPIALLSNIDARLADLLQGFGLYEPFDFCFLSYQIGFEKPDPKIYEYLIHEMRLPPEEIVFIDDSTVNVEAAKQVGLDAILFVSQAQLTEELEARMQKMLHSQ